MNDLRFTPGALARRRVAGLLACLVAAAGLVASARAEDFVAYVAGNVRAPVAGRDANGYIYMAGMANSAGFQFPDRIPPCPAPPCRDEIPTRSYDVVVLKLDPASGEILYRTYLSSSQDEWVSAMAVSPEGTVYIAGNSSAADLPVTPNALFPRPSSGTEGGFLPFSYLARVDANGALDYVSYLGETFPWNIGSMVVTPAGDLLLSGSPGRQEGRLTATPGAVDATPPEPTVFYGQPFIMKLNREADEILFRAVGVGGLLALGPDGSIFVAGSTSFPQDYPTTPKPRLRQGIAETCSSPFLAAASM